MTSHESREIQSESTVMMVDRTEGAMVPPWTARFDGRIGAAIAIALAGLYLVLALARHHSASSVATQSFAADSVKLDVWRATALLVRLGPAASIIDTRPASAFELYHLPRSINAPGASSADLEPLTHHARAVLIVSDDDAATAALVQQTHGKMAGADLHVLEDGVRSFYLTFALPVPLFSAKPPPFGYEEWLVAINDALVGNGDRDRALDALAKLQASGYAPSLLKGSKPKSSGPRKKISGGCGG